jgi:hypothetical protein
MTLLDGSEGSISHPGQFIPRKKNPVPTEQEAGLDSEPVWMVVKRKCLALRTPDRSARSESLHRLRCPVSYNTIIIIIIIIMTIQPGRFTRKAIREDYPDLMAVRSVRLSHYKHFSTSSYTLPLIICPNNSTLSLNIVRTDRS